MTKKTTLCLSLRQTINNIRNEIIRRCFFRSSNSSTTISDKFFNSFIIISRNIESDELIINLNYLHCDKSKDLLLLISKKKQMKHFFFFCTDKKRKTKHDDLHISCFLFIGSVLLQTSFYPTWPIETFVLFCFLLSVCILINKYQIKQQEQKITTQICPETM